MKVQEVAKLVADRLSDIAENKYTSYSTLLVQEAYNVVFGPEKVLEWTGFEWKEVTVIVEDTGWKYSASANPNRGYHDYERTVVFSKAINEKQLEDALKMIQDRQPGYCGWSKKIVRENAYRFTSTLDSSD